MNCSILVVMGILVSTSAFSSDNYHRGYTRKDGTYVEPHYQTAPNQNRYDNYSSQGNTNPYNDKRGYDRNEFSNPPAYNQRDRYPEGTDRGRESRYSRTIR